MTISDPVIGTVTVVPASAGGGTDYNYELWQEGNAVRQISVWDTGDRVRGVKFWKTGETDNQGTLYGTASGSEYTYTFQPGELITSMSLWPGKYNSVGDRAGGIMFTTSLSNTFNHGYTGDGGENVINVYSGILVGADIRACDDIDSWGFAFMRPIVSCHLQDVTYVDLSTLGTLAPESLDTLQSSNTSTVSVNWTLEGSKSKTVSSSWSQTEGLTFNVSMTVTAGMPEIGGAEGSYAWQENSSSTHSSSSSDTKDLTWSYGDALDPQEWVAIQVLVYSGEINVPYNGTMVVTVDTDATLSFPQSGTYTGVSVTTVDVTGENGVLT